MLNKTPTKSETIQDMTGFEKFLHDYKNDQAQLSFSKMKAFEKSPKHLVEYLNKKKEPSKAMDFGTAVHMYLLEPDKFKKTYVVLDESKRPVPDKNYQTHANRDWKREKLAEHAANDQMVVTSSDMNLIKNMGDAIFQDKASSKLINQVTTSEGKTTWKAFGYDWRGIIDCDSSDGDFVLDLKIVNPLKVEKFKWRAFEDMMVEQLESYRYAMGRKECYTIAVDNGGNVLVVRWTEAQRKIAWDNLQRLVSSLDICFLGDSWDQSYSFHHGIMEI